jgi:two-component system, NtrC family, response regulator AtoC
VARTPGRTRTAPERRQILVVDDTEGIRTYLKSILSGRGYDVVLANDGPSALGMLEQGLQPAAAVLDVMMPGIDGLEVLRRARRLQPTLPVVMLSVVSKASTIVDAMSLGAADFLSKPFEEAEIAAALERLFDPGTRSEGDLAGTANAPADEETFCWMSDKMIRIHRILEQVADADVTVLVHGESGVGKEVISREVHRLSNRRDGPFVKVNCAALPEELLESELFGYERGAFTGASNRKAGKFELANHGTIFLDEIGEMSAGLQAKFLQVLQDGEFSRLGGQSDIRVDVRVVVATNRNLEEMVAAGLFREDLYYRINVVNVFVPPLRERREEIPVLAEHFLEQYSHRYQRDRIEFSPELKQGFQRYGWPGNIRELENVVKRIVVLQSEESIREELLVDTDDAPAEPDLGAPPDDTIQPEIDVSAELAQGKLSLREIGRRAARGAEREALRRVLYQTNWNRKKAAKLLDVSYKTLLAKIKECGLGE